MVYSNVHYNHRQVFKLMFIQEIHTSLREILSCLFKLWGLESYWLVI